MPAALGSSPGMSSSGSSGKGVPAPVGSSISGAGKGAPMTPAQPPVFKAQPTPGGQAPPNPANVHNNVTGGFLS